MRDEAMFWRNVPDSSVLSPKKCPACGLPWLSHYALNKDVELDDLECAVVGCGEGRPSFLVGGHVVGVLDDPDVAEHRIVPLCKRHNHHTNTRILFSKAFMAVSADVCVGDEL
jgi:hypothetical protein